jgi:hypothetical protein
MPVRRAISSLSAASGVAMVVEERKRTVADLFDSANND